MSMWFLPGGEEDDEEDSEGQALVEGADENAEGVTDGASGDAEQQADDMPGARMMLDIEAG